MATPAELGLITPTGQDWTKDGDNAITTNAQVLAALYTAQQDDNAVYDDALLVNRDYTLLPANVDDWIGYDWQGVWPVPVPMTMFVGLPEPIAGSLGTIVIIPLGTGGSMVVVYEYGGAQSVWSRVVSTSPDRVTGWKRQDTVTRRTLLQMTAPGSPSLVDAEPARHVRLPLLHPFTDYNWDLTFKNVNERSETWFGDLDFTDVYIAPRAKDANGNYTADFASAPVNLGKPVVTGTGRTRRYQLKKIRYPRLANVEYILAYGYTDPDGGNNHLSISGSYNGLNPAGVNSMQVANAWSQYTPLDVYLSSNVPETLGVELFIDSSSGTALNTVWPHRDSWAYRVAKARGVLPVNMSQSGQTTKGFAAGGGYMLSKVLAFDPVDMVHIASGSNDSQSYTLAEMQTDFVALCDKVRSSGVSDNIMAYNFFPRASESSTVKATRKGYEAWLMSDLPGGILAAIDRAQYIDGANGLMRPELDSGDGVHLNNWGQDLMAAAVVTGEVLDPDPVVTTISHAGIAAGNVYLVTHGRTVQLICEGLKFTDTGSVTLTDFIPAGLRPRGQIFGAVRNYWGTDTAERYRITASGSLAALGVTATTQINIAETWLAV